MTHTCTPCDLCGHPVPAVKLEKYDRNPNHHCQESGHYCSAECYEEGTGARDYR